MTDGCTDPTPPVPPYPKLVLKRTLNASLTFVEVVGEA